MLLVQYSVLTIILIADYGRDETQFVDFILPGAWRQRFRANCNVRLDSRVRDCLGFVSGGNWPFVYDP